MNAKCHKCGKLGHIRKACHNKKDTRDIRSQPRATRWSKQQAKKFFGGKNKVKTVELTDSTDTEKYPLNQLTETSSSKPIELG